MTKKLNLIDVVVEILEDDKCHDVESLKTKVSLLLRNLASSWSNNFDQNKWDRLIAKKRKEAKKPVEMDPMQQAMLSMAKVKLKK